MANELRIKIKVDKDTGELVVAKKEFDKLDKSIDKTAKSTSRFSNSFRRNVDLLAHSAQALAGIGFAIEAVTKPFVDFVKVGIEHNKTMENLTSGLTTLEVATSQSITTTGKQVDITEKYAIANKEAMKSIQELTKINASTPHTLNQTVQIYKSMFASMKNAGVSSSQMVELTKKLSIAAGSAGIEFNSLLAGVDGLASGTVLANSDLGRFLSSLGITNDVLKNSSNVFETINEKLRDIQAIETYDIAMSNMKNSIDIAAGAFTEGFFESSKTGMNSISEMLNSTTLEMGYFGEKTSASFSLIGSSFQLIFRTLKLGFKESLASIEKELVDLFWSLRDLPGTMGDSFREMAIGLNTDFNLLKEDSKNLKQSLKADGNEYMDAVNKLSMSLEEYIKKQAAAKREANSSKEGLLGSSGTSEYVDIPIPDFSWIKEMNAEIAKEKESWIISLQIPDFSWIKEMNAEIAKEKESWIISLQIEGLDDSMDKMTSLLDTQIALSESGMNWGNSLSGVAGDIANIGKAISKIDVGKLKYEKADIKLQKNYAKEWLKATGDIGKQKKIEFEFENNQSKLKKTQNSAEIAGYAELAGAMSSAFEEGSTGAKAFQAIQATLGIVNAYTAITSALATPPAPVGIALGALVAGQVLPIIGMLASLGGSGGGGGSSSPYSSGELSQMAITEMEDQTVVDRLDQQIALLDAIERNGSAAALSVDLAKAEFNQAKNEWVQEIFDDSRMGWVPTMYPDPVRDVAYREDWETRMGGNILDFNESGSKIRIASSDLRNNPDVLIRAIADIANGSMTRSTPFGQKISEDLGWGDDAHHAFTSKIKQGFTDLQGYVNDWVVGIVDSISELEDASDTLKESFDAITGTAKYELEELNQAFKDFNRISNGDYAGYIEENIENMVAAQEFIDDLSGVKFEGRELTNLELLLSKVPELIDEQITQVEEFSRITGETFSGGAEEALNYIDAIELVAEAMETSRENIKDWKDSFKTDKELFFDLSSNISVSGDDNIKAYINSLYEIGLDRKADTSGLDYWIKQTESGVLKLTDVFKAFSTSAGINGESFEFIAKNMEELDTIFKILSTDTQGLTDADKKLLDANKAIIDSIRDERLSLEKQWLDILGDTAKLRELELEKIDESNHALQMQIWAYEDSIKARDEYITSEKEYIAELESSTSTIKSLINSISNARKSVSTSIDNYTPQTQYSKLDVSTIVGSYGSLGAQTQVDDLSYYTSVIDNYYSQQLELMQKQYDAQIESNSIAKEAETERINDWNSIASSLSSIQDFVENERYATADYANSNLAGDILALRGAVSANNVDYVSDLSNRVTSSASTVLGSLSTSQLATDDAFKRATILSRLDSLPTREVIELDDVNTSVNSFEEANKNAIDNLKNEAISYFEILDSSLTLSSEKQSSELAILEANISESNKLIEQLEKTSLLIADDIQSTYTGISMTEMSVYKDSLSDLSRTNQYGMRELRQVEISSDNSLKDLVGELKRLRSQVSDLQSKLQNIDSSTSVTADNTAPSAIGAA